jgi:hypothetical protein
MYGFLNIVPLSYLNGSHIKVKDYNIKIYIFTCYDVTVHNLEKPFILYATPCNYVYLYRLSEELDASKLAPEHEDRMNVPRKNK